MIRIDAISLWQPWASLWVSGAKRTETRSWALHGPLPRVLAVHATKRWPAGVVQALAAGGGDWEVMRRLAAEIGYARAADMPLGAVLGLVEVASCLPTEDADPSPEDRACGDFSPGRYGWGTSARLRFPHPYPARGAQGVWAWEAPDEVGPWLESLRRQAAAAPPPPSVYDQDDRPRRRKGDPPGQGKLWED